MKVNFNDLNSQWKTIEQTTRPQLDNLFSTSAYINGPAVQEFENDFSEFVGAKYAIGVSNGTDAIKIAAEALSLKGKIGVFIPANTFIATLIGAEQAIPSAEFVLIDCDQYYQIDTKILENELKKNRSKWDNCLLIPVHLYGHSVNMSEIMRLAEEYDCKVLEDASQSHGTQCESGTTTGNMGHISAFSLYPGKNLGAAGDAGVITTNDSELADKVKLLRNWGSRQKYYYDSKGYNNRLDTIQAIILKEKLKHLDEWNREREKIAKIYNLNIKNSLVTKPEQASYCLKHTYHVYCLRAENRDGLIRHLNDHNIQTNIHYPVPIELTKPYRHLRSYNKQTRQYAKMLVSLPIHPFMTSQEAEYVCDIVNKWEGF